MLYLSVITRILSLATVAAFAATTGFAKETPPSPETAPTLPIGEWYCNGDETNIFRIQEDKAAINFKNKGTWLVTGNTLTINWENGAKLAIDITQTGAWKFKNAVPTLPAERTLIDTQGRAIKVTVLGKDTDSIKVRRTDGKELDIALDKLSEADRAFLAIAEVKKPVEFANPRMVYGYHLILRINGNTFAVEINAKSDPEADRKFDNCAYAISYTIRRRGKNGNLEKIQEGVAKETRPSKGNELLTCDYFKFAWSAGGAATGRLYLKSLPEGAEFYGELLGSLENLDTQIDPTRWVKMTK